jgi:hypothetical protein
MCEMPAVQEAFERAVADDPDQFMAQVLPFIPRVTSGPEDTVESDHTSDFLKRFEKVCADYADNPAIASHLDNALRLLKCDKPEPRRADYSLLLACEAAQRAEDTNASNAIFRLRQDIVREYRNDFREYIPTKPFKRSHSMF